MDTIHIAAVCNNDYAKHTAVMFNSILENKISKNEINFYVIGNLSKEIQMKINNSVKKFGAKVHFLKVSESQFEGFKLFSYFTKEAYYRLLIPDLLEEHIKKVIYLDSDIIVKHDITNLWDIDINDHLLAAVQDVGFCASKIRRKILSIPLSAGYFNSGVMILNLIKWRDNNISKKVINFAKENPNKLRSIDQDALNAILYDKWLRINPKWNYITARIRKRKLQKNPAIIHFTGKNKPWTNGHPLKNEYFHYEKSTLWTIQTENT